MLRKLSSFLLFVSLAGGATQLMAQEHPASVCLTDATDNSPIAFAHICFEGFDKQFKQYVLSNEKGEASCLLPHRVVMAISFVGYQTLYDTIAPGERLRIRLERTTTNIEPVVVTAQYTPQRADKSIYRVKVITSKQIEMKAVTNLSDLLRSEVNIRTNQDGVLGSSISLQGLSGENVKFLIDGIPVIGRMNGNIDLGQLNLNNADHVEIIEGPMSVVYGSNALAGVINIITRENHNDRLMMKVNSYAESVGVVNFDGALSVKAGRQLFAFSGGRNYFGGFSDPDTSRARQWKPKRQVFADGSWLYSLPKVRFKLGAQFFDELLLSKGNLIGPYFETAFDNEFYTRRYVTRGDFSWQPAKNHSVTALASWSGFDRRKETWIKDLTTLDKTLTTNAEDQDTTTFSNHTLRGQWSRHNDDDWLNWQTGFDFNLENGTGKRIDNGQQTMGDYAAFVSLMLRPHPLLEIQPGARAAYNTRYAAPIVYSLNAKFIFNEWLTLRGSAAKGFRAPALKELYLYFVDVNHNIRGNPDLKAENSDNFNLALQFQREKSRYQVTTNLSAFYNHIRNIITLAQNDQQLYSYVNVDDYRSQGIQLQSTVRYFPRLVVAAGIGITGRASTTSANQYSWSTDVSTEATYQWLRQDVSMTVWYKYTGRMPQLVANETNELTETSIAGYHMLDISFNKSFLNNRWNIGIGTKNLFDVKTIESTGNTGGIHTGGSGSQPVGWGRSGFIKLSYQFTK